MKVQVCTGKTCSSKFSQYIITRLQNDKKKFDIKSLSIDECACMGNCKKWPNVMFDKAHEEYMTPAKASKKVFDSLKK